VTTRFRLHRTRGWLLLIDTTSGVCVDAWPREDTAAALAAEDDANRGTA
jgi:hypothetical protein